MDNDDNGSNERSFDVGMDVKDLGTTARKTTGEKFAAEKYAESDPELAWWNGETDGREPA